jgi:hypothetical protein
VVTVVLEQPEAALQVVREEDAVVVDREILIDREARVVRANAVLEHGLDLGARGAGVVGLDAEPVAGREARAGDLVAALGDDPGALHLPALAADRGDADAGGGLRGRPWDAPCSGDRAGRGAGAGRDREEGERRERRAGHPDPGSTHHPSLRTSAGSPQD